MWQAQGEAAKLGDLLACLRQDAILADVELDNHDLLALFAGFGVVRQFVDSTIAEGLDLLHRAAPLRQQQVVVRQFILDELPLGVFAHLVGELHLVLIPRTAAVNPIILR